MFEYWKLCLKQNNISIPFTKQGFESQQHHFFFFFKKQINITNSKLLKVIPRKKKQSFQSSIYLSPSTIHPHPPQKTC